MLPSGQGEGEGEGSTCGLQTLAVEGTTLCGILPVGVARPVTHQTKKQTKMHRRHSSPWSVTSWSGNAQSERAGRKSSSYTRSADLSGITVACITIRLSPSMMKPRYMP